jgi:hypothetical protein
MGVIVSKKPVQNNSPPVTANSQHSSIQRSQSESGESVRHLKLIFP